MLWCLAYEGMAHRVAPLFRKHARLGSIVHLWLRPTLLLMPTQNDSFARSSMRFGLGLMRSQFM